jgi:hypothetical protein
LTQRSAITVGNGHVTGVRRAARTPRQKQQENNRVISVLVLIVLIIVVAIGVHLFDLATASPYGDGYQWGEANTVGVISKTAPSCSRSEMVSSRGVDDPNFIFNKPVGDDKPSDNFAQWHSGCEAAAKSVIADFNST